MVGTESKNSKWKDVVGNFLITFLAQLAFVAQEALGTGAFPTALECYRMGITSLVATLGFYGVNRIIRREPT